MGCWGWKPGWHSAEQEPYPLYYALVGTFFLGEILKEPLSLGCGCNFRIITELRYWKLTSWVKQAGGGVR